MKLTRELALACVLLAALGAGIGYDALTDDIEASERVRLVEPLFDERSVHCPRPPVPGRSGSKLVIGAAAGEALPVGVGDDRIDLPAERTKLVHNGASTEIVGFGGEVVASAVGSVTGTGGGLVAARCSKVASPEWHFAEGSSALGFEQRLAIYNPFPDEAVVSVSLYTPKGEQGNANLAEGRAVPAGQTIEIALNEFIRQQRFVGMSVRANRGRVIAWRVMTTNGEDRPEGTQFTLGATSPAETWHFPEGALEDGVDERISLLNPTDEEAIATLSLSTATESVQPPRLVEVVIPPHSLLPVPLREYVGGTQRDVGGAGVVVRTTSGRVVAERTVYYETDQLSGVASEVGIVQPSSEWFLGPAVEKPATDSVVLLNAGAQEATVSLTLLSGNQEPQNPAPLQDLTIKGGTRLKLPIGEWTRGKSISVHVTSDQDIVAERFGSGDGDVASVMGLQLARPSEQ